MHSNSVYGAYVLERETYVMEIRFLLKALSITKQMLEQLRFRAVHLSSAPESQNNTHEVPDINEG